MELSPCSLCTATEAVEASQGMAKQGANMVLGLVSVCMSPPAPWVPCTEYNMQCYTSKDCPASGPGKAHWVSMNRASSLGLCSMSAKEKRRRVVGLGEVQCMLQSCCFTSLSEIHTALPSLAPKGGYLCFGRCLSASPSALSACSLPPQGGR